VHRTLVATFLAAAILAGSCPASAASWFDDSQQALPCRPTIACTADLVPPGSLELEMGYLFQRLGDPVTQQSVPFLAKLTLADWVQFQIGSNGPTFVHGPEPTHYVRDLVTGFKFHVVDQSARAPSVSLSVELSIPLAAATGYIRTYDLLGTLYVSKDFSWLHVDLNLGLNAWRIDGPTLLQPWAALAFSADLPWHLTAMAETYYFHDASPIAPKDGGLLLAVGYAVRPWLVFDAGGDLGYFPSQRSASAFVGMTIFPGNFWQSASELRARHHP
jgi:hypothetical protein